MGVGGVGKAFPVNDGNAGRPCNVGECHAAVFARVRRCVSGSWQE